MWTYWLGGSGMTVHVSPDCRSARRCLVLVQVASPHPPELVWDLLWHNHAVTYGTTRSDYGAEVLPVLGECEPQVDQTGYGVERWGCLHCLEQAALDRGWVNTWPRDPRRRHR